MTLIFKLILALLVYHTQVYMVPAASTCIDNPNDFYNYDEQAMKNCQWAGRNENRRSYHCLQHEGWVHEYCPRTCGACCEDDPDYTLPTLFDTHTNANRTCEWVAKTKRRQHVWCQNKMVRKACSVACDSCVSNVRLRDPKSRVLKSNKGVEINTQEKNTPPRLQQRDHHLRRTQGLD